ncbi:MAG: hypothetical protein ABI407_14990 [Bradyrhizobium sp.]
MMEKIIMTTPQSATAAERPLGRDLLGAARYYLGNRWGLLGLGSVAVTAGLSFGGWGWLVAAGLAPVILSTLPCLVMCGLGVCVACRSVGKQPNQTGDATNVAMSSAAFETVKKDNDSPAGAANCCQRNAGQTKSPQVASLASHEERNDSHA